MKINKIGISSDVLRHFCPEITGRKIIQIITNNRAKGLKLEIKSRNGSAIIQMAFSNSL